MPQKRTAMKKLREILRQSEEAKLSQRQIANALKVSRPVVSETLRKFKETGLTSESINGISDSALEEVLSSISKHKKKHNSLYELFPEYLKELKKPGVTLDLLWSEYLEANPDGLQYSRFCYHFAQWKKLSEISMHFEHSPGDKMFVDYAGKKFTIIDRETQKSRTVETFIAILGATGLTYVEASDSQRQESFIRSVERSFGYFGGVTRAIVPDNLKSAVIKADKYDPEINPLFDDFANYYRTTIIPTRARKPKDKALVENAVRLAYIRIYAPLRNKTFYSMEELNEAIAEKLEAHNNRKLTKMPLSRREYFEATEKKTLKLLPVAPYPLKSFDGGKVSYNYHIELKEDKHHYSVPYTLNGKNVRIIYDERIVAIYHDNIRVVQHIRNRTPYKYTTLSDHMPSNHRFIAKWSAERFKKWAADIGEDTLRVITHVLESKSHPEQGYKTCMGILNQAKKYGNDDLNIACRQAWNYNWMSTKYIKEILESLQLQKESTDSSLQLNFIPNHKNIRGKENYS